MRQKRGQGKKGTGTLIFGAGNAPLLHAAIQELESVPDSGLTAALHGTEVALLVKVDLSVWTTILDRADALLANYVTVHIPTELRLDGEADEASSGSEHTPDTEEVLTLLPFLTKLLEDSTNRRLSPALVFIAAVCSQWLFSGTFSQAQLV